MGFICLKKHLFLVFFEKMSESSDYNIYIYIYIYIFFFFLKNMHYCYLQVDSNLFSEYTTVNFFKKSLQKKKKKEQERKQIFNTNFEKIVV